MGLLVVKDPTSTPIAERKVPGVISSNIFRDIRAKLCQHRGYADYHEALHINSDELERAHVLALYEEVQSETSSTRCYR